jgi:hypothetical protein
VFGRESRTQIDDVEARFGCELERKVDRLHRCDVWSGSSQGAQVG